MPPVLPSTRFIQIYDSLPPDKQRELVESHIGPALDKGPRKQAKRVVHSASRFKRRQAAIPVLAYRAKRRELNELIADLARDAKCAAVKERSNRDALMTEIIHTITTWLADIWIAVYEHHVHFDEAHASLLFIAQTIKKLGDGSRVGGCSCATKTYQVVLDIHNLKDEKVKRFDFHGPQHLNRVILWMWRELFVSMSVANSQRSRRQIPPMLDDIEDELGWKAIPRILYGGQPASGEDDEEEQEDEGEDDWEDLDEDDDYDEDDLDDELDSQTGEVRCTCSLHASHWSSQVNRQRLNVRRIVKVRLENLFAVVPSRSLYCVLRGLGSNDLLGTLSKIATNSSDNLVAALDIYATESRTKSILRLLDEHSHLLRPRDSATLQIALISLTADPTARVKALAIVEREMCETIQMVFAAIRSAFHRIDEPKYVADMNRILKLSGSQQRAERIERWLDEVVTPSSGPLQAVAFAAMMMGIPAPGLDEGEDPDFLGHLDLDPNDPVMQDLREELRPPFGERFEGWNEVASAFKGSTSTLTRVYSKLVQVMPFLKAADVTECMQSRISDRPSKRHVGDALATLSSFATVQRKKAALRAENKKRKAQQQQAPRAVVDDDEPPPLEPIDDAAAPFGGLSGGFSFSFNLPPPPPPPPAQYPNFGGIDDVD